MGITRTLDAFSFVLPLGLQRIGFERLQSDHSVISYPYIEIIDYGHLVVSLNYWFIEWMRSTICCTVYLEKVYTDRL